MFPQSIWMTHDDRIEQTRRDFNKHPNLQLGARDQPSYDWLEKTFGPSEKNGPEGSHVMRSLTPDIVYMYGNRPDYRLNTEKK
jgi:exopolysaccharide biosynthesis predicted pyruvyltransferase EpsI